MKVEDAVRFFGTKAALADALGIRPNAVTGWKDFVPAEHRPTIVVLSQGEVMPSVDDVNEWTMRGETLREAVRIFVERSNAPKTKKGKR